MTFKDWVDAVNAFLTPIIAILAVFIAWKLNVLSTEKTRDFTLKKEKYDELKELYTDIFAIFENAMKQIRTQNFSESGFEFNKINGKIHLLAPENIIQQYSLTCSILERWSSLHTQAFPKRTEIIYPDPAQKFKEPAQKEYDNLQEEIKKLLDLMRVDLEKRT